MRHAWFPGLVMLVGAFGCHESNECRDPSCVDASGVDRDGDGFESCSGVGIGCDCEDDVAAINPGASEICGDGIDQDCDGDDALCDDDGDGYATDVDCDDSDPEVHPGATETCDGRDEDCNDLVDDSEDCRPTCEGVDLDTDPENCGGCGNRCGTGESCVGGECTCGPVTAAAAGEQACPEPTPAPGTSEVVVCCGGACADLRSEDTHCGACGVVCGAHATCADRACECEPPGAGQEWADCNGDLSMPGSDGCETDLQSDASHCGACGDACGSSGVCTAGTCG